MSTRATIHFETKRTHDYVLNDATGRYDRIERTEPIFETEAIVYRHSDGYPEGLGADLVRFIEEVRHLNDGRLNDPSYLAAKWVVFDVSEYQRYMAESNARQKAAGERPYYDDPPARLDFLGVGIVMADPGDIEYRYHVVCDGRVDTIAYDDGVSNDPIGILNTTVLA